MRGSLAGLVLRFQLVAEDTFGNTSVNAAHMPHTKSNKAYFFTTNYAERHLPLQGFQKPTLKVTPKTPKNLQCFKTLKICLAERLAGLLAGWLAGFQNAPELS